MKKTTIIAISIIVLIAIAVFLRRQTVGENAIQKKTRFLLNTPCTIQIPGGKENIKVIERVFDRIEEIDIKFNIMNPASPIYDFNENNIPISDPEVIEVVKSALKLSEETNGAFDITVEPLMRLWGFYGESPSVPAQADIDQCLKRVGYKKLILKANKLQKLRSDVRIDLGGIAKGYAVGEALKILKKNNIDSALINFGGDIYALGRKGKRSWKIGLQHPREEGYIGVLELSGISIATSGDYERYFEEDGRRYHHILDPKTGYPATGVISATVVSANATLADALTKIFVMGKDKGIAFIEKRSDAEAVMMTADQEIHYTSGIGKMFKAFKQEN